MDTFLMFSSFLHFDSVLQFFFDYQPRPLILSPLCMCPCSRWFKEGRLLTDQQKYQTYSELRSGVLVLVIKNLTERDLGHYECEVGLD